MGFIDDIKARAKTSKKTIVLPETEDIRTYEAAEAVLKEGTANLILVGSEEEIAKNKGSFDISGATIVDPATDARTEGYIAKLVEFHKNHGKIATLTAVMLEQQKGVLDIGGDNAVKSFREKSVMDGAPINAGYMVLNPEIFDYIEGDNTVFEKDPLEKLAKEGQLMSYMHNGFWQCMDNKREMDMLEKYLSTGTAPWKKW